MNKNKILYISIPEWPNDIRVAKEVETLRKNNFDISILLGNKDNKPAEELIDGVSVYRIKNTFSKIRALKIIFNYPAWLFTIIRTIVKTRPDLIIVRDIPLADICVFAAKLLRKKIVFDVAENFPALAKAFDENKNNPILNFLYVKMDIYKNIEKNITKADKIIVVCEESKQRIIDTYKIPEKKISIVGNTPYKKILTKNTHVTSVDKLKIVYTGQIDAHFRGIQNVMEAANILRENNNIEFNIIGYGLYCEKAKKYAEKHNLGNVNFLGKMPHKELLAFLTTQDVGIVPHTASDVIQYTMPNKIFDYMAYSLPVIVSSARPLKRIVEECNNGYIFEAENSQSLADVILYILNHKEELQQKSENGYKYAENKYNWENDEVVLTNTIKDVIKGEMNKCR